MSHTVLATMDISVLDAGASLGLPRAEMIAAWGGDAALLDNPDARIPIEHHIALWRYFAERRLGLELGAKVGLGYIGVVGYAVQHGSTVAEALDWLYRFRALVHPDVVPQTALRESPAGKLLVFSRAVHPPFTTLREPVYAQAAALVSSFTSLLGYEVRARFVAYPLPRPADPERHEHWFGCPVSWGGPLLEVAFSAELLERPLKRADPALFSYLATRTEELHRQLPRADDIPARVRHEIGTMLAQGEPRAAAVAKRLAMSTRTLTRRLAVAGTSFAELLSALRQERALLLLEDHGLTASQVGFLLGYAEPATFFRAFKRWTGRTPEGWRRQRPDAAGISIATVAD